MNSKSLALFLASVCTTVFARGPTAPPWKFDNAPAGFDISSISFEGSGCPEGTTYAIENAEESAITAAFSVLYAEGGANTSSTSNCKVSLALTVPAGYSVGIDRVTYSSFYDLEAGVSASRFSVYSFEGQTAQLTSQSDYTGPISNSQVSTSDVYDSTTSVKSGCGESTVLSIDLAVGVDTTAAGSALGFGVIDTIDAHLQWEAC